MPVRRTASLIVTVSLAGWGSLVPATSHAGTPVMCHGQMATIVGTPGDDKIEGTDGPDVIAALGGRNRIHANGGDDIICGAQAVT